MPEFLLLYCLAFLISFETSLRNCPWGNLRVKFKFLVTWIMQHFEEIEKKLLEKSALGLGYDKILLLSAEQDKHKFHKTGKYHFQNTFYKGKKTASHNTNVRLSNLFTKTRAFCLTSCKAFEILILRNMYYIVKKSQGNQSEMHLQVE